jgi:2-hydroxyglutarate dehydrogenase
VSSPESLLAPPPRSCGVAVVGGGILGLAVARQLSRGDPRSRVCVLEREANLATHQTGHSSGVIHAGIFYRPGSLKAQLCVQGARELLEFCAARDIPHERCGKLILATRHRELAGLDELQRRGNANGVPALRRVDTSSISQIEPHARAIAGLYSPSTAIVDFPAVASAYAREVLEAGGKIAGSCTVTGVEAASRSLTVMHSQGATKAGYAIFCAGAWADRLAVAAGAEPDSRIVPFRGAYMRLVPGRRHLVRSLIYPVPDPSLPFLGVHLTRHTDGEVLIGPTALIAGARDAYTLRTVRRADVLDTLAWPGTWRMLARAWPTAATELHRAVSHAAFVRAAARMVPELTPDDVEPSFAGVRGQAVDRNGRLLDDFAFSHTPRALHVRNAPSPAASASLAIARHVCEEARRSFGLRR